MKEQVFEFNYIDNGTGIIQSKPMSFFCPVCEDFHIIVGLEKYIPHHDFYEGLTFFCNNCFSEFKTIENSKIKLISEAFVL